MRSGAGLAAMSASIRLRLLAGAAAEVHQHPQVERVHVAHDLRVAFGRELPVMAVNVDDRILRPRHGVRGHDQRGLRLVLADVERSCAPSGRRAARRACGDWTRGQDAPGGARRECRSSVTCKKVPQSRRKPNSVRLRRASAALAAPHGELRRDDHSSSPAITGGIKRPTRRLRTGRPRSTPPYLVLLRAGFCLPPVLPRARCALTAPFHPYPLRSRRP